MLINIALSSARLSNASRICFGVISGEKRLNLIQRHCRSHMFLIRDEPRFRSTCVARRRPNRILNIQIEFIKNSMRLILDSKLLIDFLSA